MIKILDRHAADNGGYVKNKNRPRELAELLRSAWEKNPTITWDSMEHFIEEFLSQQPEFNTFHYISHLDPRSDKNANNGVEV